MPRRRTSKKKQVGFSGVLLFLLLAAICAGAVYLAVRGVAPGDPPEVRTAGETGTEPAAAPAGEPRPAASSTPPAPPPYETYEDVPDEPAAAAAPGAEPPAELEPPPPGTRVAVVIDDLGRDPRDVAALGRLAVPMTYAVLPFETRTAEVVREIRRGGHELILHLPMEARGPANPGPGALLAAMDEGQLERGTLDALAAVPGAVGVNNHMGSLLSSDPRAMRVVLSVLSGRDLYFLDSRTSAESIGFRLATSLGMPAAERQVFLDRDASREAVTAEFRRLLAVARERGSAIAIGHPYPVTLEVLAQEVPRAVELGYEFVPVSFLLERSTAPAR